MLRRLLKLIGRNSATPKELDVESLRRENALHLLASVTMHSSELVSSYPPRIENAKKRILFENSLARPLTGSLTVYRFNEIPLPNSFDPYGPDTEITATRGYFRYQVDDSADHWYLNFAHHDLFSGYGHFMFAQDEIQVAEHPVLACAREMMLARGDELRPLTVEGRNPTPVLFRKVPRTLDIQTSQIYGARFSRADEQVIRDAIRFLEPITFTNILAIEAPISCGNETYSYSEIEFALRTAYSGFRAIVLSAATQGSVVRPIVLHTGNWGCGAYGGNRQLMLSIQMMAARLAGLHKIILHCGSDSVDDVKEFETLLRKRFSFSPGARLTSVLNKLARNGFQWGSPDGN